MAVARAAALAAVLLLAGGAAAPPGLGAEEVFVDRAAEAGIDFVHFNGMSGELYFAEMMGAGAALFDYDGDGDLDVYLVQGTMLGEGKRIEDAVFPPRHPLPLSDRLYRNDLEVRPDGTRVLRFTDVTEESGIARLARGYGMGVAAGDYDNDGHLDLYLTNLGPNQLLRNNGDGTFSDVTEETGTGDPLWGVPAVFFDYDRDGWLDLFVGNYVDFRIATHKPCTSPAGAR
ncbi:MAG TPA: VCBS repeat-containing protein, partial [Thermoanaerobaculia bacterium]|nr:VCBS repeat-containing protein [Thermoanaerobaculia bacterium]